VSDPGSFLAPAAGAHAEVREKGSRFLGFLFPIVNEEEAERSLRELRAQYPDATHHCWAYRLGWPPRERASDDGEPSGTAGTPMLKVLAGRGLSDVLVVAVRWFGGTKLGKGGLARAYGATAREAAESAQLVERFPTVALAVEIPYERLGAVKRLVRSPEVEIENGVYEERVRLTLRVAESIRHEVEGALADLGVDAELV